MKLLALCGFFFVFLLCLNAFTAEGFPGPLRETEGTAQRELENIKMCLQEHSRSLSRKDRRQQHQIKPK